MIRTTVGSALQRFTTGIWSMQDSVIEFLENKERVLQENTMVTNGFTFKTEMNQLEEILFLAEFQTSDPAIDPDFIDTQDIINFVLYCAPAEIMTNKLIEFVHTKTVKGLIRALIMYFEYYIKLVEFILIMRDEMEGKHGKIESKKSQDVKYILSNYLIQYRLLIAREYSIILMGQDDMELFYHRRSTWNIPKCAADLKFHEGFIAVCTQIVWIAMHRRNELLIKMELGRLFRSEHFKLTRNEGFNFTPAEKRLLYGKNYKVQNYRVQTSPLMQELGSISKKNLPIIWIGKRKYNGDDIRLRQLELEFIVPANHLQLINASFGILGHPKDCYTTHLNLKWYAVRTSNYTKIFDPHKIRTQPHLVLPDLNEERIRKCAKSYESLYEIRDTVINSREVIRKWKHRDSIMDLYFKSGIKADIESRCENQLRDIKCGRSTANLIREFLLHRKLKLKKL